MSVSISGSCKHFWPIQNKWHWCQVLNHPSAPFIHCIASLPNSPNTKVEQTHLCYHLVCRSHSDQTSTIAMSASLRRNLPSSVFTEVISARLKVSIALAKSFIGFAFYNYICLNDLRWRRHSWSRGQISNFEFCCTPQEEKVGYYFQSGTCLGASETHVLLSFLWSIFCKWPVITVTPPIMKIAVHKIQYYKYIL